jgi:putative CocE/NonD family hydrolase
MSDLPRDDGSWQVLPQDYLRQRPATYVACRLPESLYLATRDGVRLAIDVYLPLGAEGLRLPTLVICTPYYRRFTLRDGAPAASEPSVSAGRYRDFFVPRGYALVVVDVRGTGASFGVRESFRSPKERDDYREVVDWIVGQPWSDGAVCATGISYVGAAADFLASTGHPAVKAIAPLFSVWDTYSDHYYPGGMLLNRLAQTYDELMVALDHGRGELLAQFAYYKDPYLAGPAPVDDDPDGVLLQAALAEHLGNFHMPDFIREFAFKEEGLSYDRGFSSASFSPYAYCAGVHPDVAVYSVSGWMDGAGYSNAAIARYLSLPNPRRHLLLGPWDHGARANASPFRSQVEPAFPLFAELLRFFDHYVRGVDTGLEREAPVHYFTMAEERWHAAAQWPPLDDTTQLYLADDGRLAAEPGIAGEDRYHVDFTLATGSHTRYGRLAAFDVRYYYTEWHGRDARMLCYTGAPLAAAHALSGHPVVTLHLTASEADAALHVYLEDVAPDGVCRYVTEGMLRALHRKEASAPPYHQVVGPYRTYARADAAPLVPGQVATLRFALLPTSWQFAAGHRVRLAIAGADADNFGQVPHGRPPVLSILRGGAHASSLVLPRPLRIAGELVGRCEAPTAGL